MLVGAGSRIGRVILKVEPFRMLARKLLIPETATSYSALGLRR
jgi:hypothetical protein